MAIDAFVLMAASMIRHAQLEPVDAYPRMLHVGIVKLLVPTFPVSLTGCFSGYWVYRGLSCVLGIAKRTMLHGGLVPPNES
ncbi:MAG: hypothetical protein AB7U78_18660 [Hyphomicrobiaceae bacterium]